MQKESAYKEEILSLAKEAERAGLKITAVAPEDVCVSYQQSKGE